MTSDAVTVVVPAYNVAEYVGEAISSILGQRGDWVVAVLVVDDGSTDDTAAAAASFGPPVRVIRCAHSGAGAARNAGLAEARTDFVAFLDADDVWPETSLETRMAMLAADPELDVVFGNAEQFACDELADDERARARFAEHVGPAQCAGTMLARRSLFDRVGMFPVHREAGEFIEWWIGARTHDLQVATVDDVVLRRRIHAANLGRRHEAAHQSYLRIVRAELTRRRDRG